MPDTITIKLAGRDFTIRPLVFKQLREFQPAILKSKGILHEPSDFDYALGAILVCTMRDNPEFTRAVADDSVITPQEILDAIDALAVWSGVLKRVDKKDGEAGEAPATANP